MEALAPWIRAGDRLPVVGQLIVAHFERPGTYWAGKYIGPKQAMDKWLPLIEATDATPDRA